jgi:hypothetical protein
MALSPLRLPPDIAELLEAAAKRAGVPVRSPLLDQIEPQDARFADNVIPFRKIARRA